MDGEFMEYHEYGMLAVTEAGYWISVYSAWAALALVASLTGAGLWLFWRCHKRLQALQRRVQELGENADSFRYLVETAHEGIVVVQNKRLVYLNPRMCEMTGYSEAELKALPSFLPLIDPSVRDVMMANHLRRLAGEPSPQRYESLFLKKDGSSYPIELSGVAIVWQGRPATLNMLTDISARKVAEEKMQYLAHHDLLTGLPNRYMLHERLQQAIALAQRTGVPLAVLFIDLNGFKQVNDSHGHEVGDCLLQQVAMRIKPLLRESDTLARMGGDEFVALLTQVSDPQGVAHTVARIKGPWRIRFG
ncbi:diguanylate cyclase [Oceanimonas pelagia]|uniref:Diguanylate cyclase n=1 Tax=Oceanimonas pelagia TaxID=3028314 RepID=A0AA50KPJ6_9GAMM|nr:diguanylate cyclase [Oceanimonas pelagia]WMC11640.1 diguanylate cyclase [Oceanimonas pelagia]